MGERAAQIFPFAIAVVLPPAGFVLGLMTLDQDRELAIRILVIAVLAALIWFWVLS